MDWPFSLQLNEPWMLLCIAPLLALAGWRLWRKPQVEVIHFSGLEYAIDAGVRLAGDRRAYRALLVLMLTFLLGLAWTAPEIRTARPLLFGPARELTPAFLIALDVSGSMTEPMGGYVINGELNLNGPTRFEAAREQIYAFTGRHPAAKFGLVLFSVQPMLVRWPTAQTEFDFHDVLDEGMRFTNPDRQRTSQLARFAGGTSTRAGLVMAGKVLENQNASGASLILAGDLIYNIDEVIEGIQNIDLDDVFIHVIALDPQPEGLEQFTAAFGDQANINVFPVNSVQELGAAFSRIEELEIERRDRGGARNYVQDMRWFLSLLAFVLGVATIYLFETALHKTHV
jgi:hypothetical protein